MNNLNHARQLAARLFVVGMLLLPATCLDAATTVTKIAAGGAHSLFLESDGSLWTMGLNRYGLLGDGTVNNTNRPEQIVASGVAAIAGGSLHSLFLKTDGSLWAMGLNTDGQLGDGFVDRGSPSYGTATPEQIVPSPQPILTFLRTRTSQNNLQLTAACGFGGNFYLLAGASFAQPLGQWTPVWTNSITARGSRFTAPFSDAVNSGPQQFYILQSH